ncbi:MAG: DUF1585 domain-containing protein, partial [Planctomycetota bacterium]
STDPSGFGEGAIFLGAIGTNTERGIANFEVEFPAIPVGHVITATATHRETHTFENGTSEFSNAASAPPPPDVPELDESGETLGTLRQQLEQHRANPNCAVCHTKMDALGFGLENFDAIGKWRDQDGRNPIDPSGILPGGRKFQGPVDLVNLLAEDKKTAFCRCMSRKMLTYALGRGLGVYDRCTINGVLGRLESDNYRFQTLIKSIVTSDPFRLQEQAD